MRLRRQLRWPHLFPARAACRRPAGRASAAGAGRTAPGLCATILIIQQSTQAVTGRVCNISAAATALPAHQINRSPPPRQARLGWHAHSLAAAPLRAQGYLHSLVRAPSPGALVRAQAVHGNAHDGLLGDWRGIDQVQAQAAQPRHRAALHRGQAWARAAGRWGERLSAAAASAPGGCSCRGRRAASHHTPPRLHLASLPPRPTQHTCGWKTAFRPSIAAIIALFTRCCGAS